MIELPIWESIRGVILRNFLFLFFIISESIFMIFFYYVGKLPLWPFITFMSKFIAPKTLSKIWLCIRVSWCCYLLSYLICCSVLCWRNGLLRGFPISFSVSFWMVNILISLLTGCDLKTSLASFKVTIVRD